MDNYDYLEDHDRDGRGAHDVQAELTRPLSQAAISEQAGYGRGRDDVPEYERDRLAPSLEYDRLSSLSDQSRKYTQLTGLISFYAFGYSRSI